MKKKTLITTVMLSTLLTGCVNQPLRLTNSELVVEFGTKIPKYDMTYFLEGYDEAYLQEVELDTSKVNLDKIGKYDITFTHTSKLFKNVETVIGKVIVKDTTKPEFVDFKEKIKVEQNAQCVDMPKYFKATDLSGEVEIETDCKEKVNFKKPGKYNMTVKATDKNKNTSEKKCEVEIVASKSITTKTLGELTPYAVGEDSKDLPKVPVSEATETKVVEGKVSNKAVQPVATKGIEVSKGNYSTEDKQKAYEKKLADEKAKKEAEAKKKAAEKKAREEKARQEALAKQQQQQQQAQQTYQPTTNTTTQQGANTSSGSNNNSNSTSVGSGNTSQGGGTTTTKPQTTTKPTQPACDDSIPAGAFTTYEGALQYSITHRYEHSGYRVGNYLNNCGTQYFTIIWKD